MSRQHSTDPSRRYQRTELAWERTGIALIVAGVLFARYAAGSSPVAVAGVGLAAVLAGAAVLLWASGRDAGRDGPPGAGRSPVHPTAAKLVGATTVAFTFAALALAVAIAVVD